MWFTLMCLFACKSCLFYLVVVTSLSFTAVLVPCCFMLRFSHSFIKFMDDLMDEYNCSIAESCTKFLKISVPLNFRQEYEVALISNQ